MVSTNKNLVLSIKFLILTFSLTLVFPFDLFLFCSDQLLPVTDAVDIWHRPGVAGAVLQTF